MLGKNYIDNTDKYAAFKLAYWYENFSPEIDLKNHICIFCISKFWKL